jgi:hypothetical protein
MELQTIVVPIDGSTPSLRAVPVTGAASYTKVRLVTLTNNDAELAWDYQVHAAAELVPADTLTGADVLVDGDPVGVLLDIAVIRAMCSTSTPTISSERRRSSSAGWVRGSWNGRPIRCLPYRPPGAHPRLEATSRWHLTA